MSNQPPATPSLQTVQKLPSPRATRSVVFASVALFHLVLWVDVRLRWGLGFPFAQLEWLRDAGVIIALQLFVAWLVDSQPGSSEPKHSFRHRHPWSGMGGLFNQGGRPFVGYFQLCLEKSGF